MIRLELECGHTAFSLSTEENRVGRPRPCYSCGEGVWSKIVARSQVRRQVKRAA